MSFALSAQTFNTVTAMGASDASMTYNDTDTLVATVTGGFESVSVQAVFTGSVTGYAGLYGSIDGVNYLAVGTATLALSGAGATDNKTWIVEGNPYKKYAVIAVGTGTVTGATSTYKGYILPNHATNFTGTVAQMGSRYGNYSDTVTNGATKYMTIKVAKGYNSVSIQPLVTKVSGTAGGTVTLQASNDGVNFTTINTGYVSNDVTAAPFTTGGAATLSVTNVAINSKIFVVRGSPYEFYRISYAGTGTMVCTLRGYVLAE